MNKNPELAKRFLRAWVKGLDWAINNQKAAIDNMRRRVPEINEKEATANFAEIARISQSRDTQAHGLGWQDPAVWAKQEEFMREHDVISSKVRRQPGHDRQPAASEIISHEKLRLPGRSGRSGRTDGVRGLRRPRRVDFAPIVLRSKPKA